MSEGLRFNEGKTRWDLVPYDALNEVAKVSTFGAVTKGYGERNWEKGMRWSNMVASTMRHLYARMSGERLDPESGLPHLAHLAWNALALLAYDLRGVGENDIGECACGPTQTVELSPGESKTVVYAGGDLRVVVKPGEATAVFDDLAEANPEDESAEYRASRDTMDPSNNGRSYEGVTREQGRLGCSFLQGLYQFGAKK